MVILETAPINKNACACERERERGREKERFDKRLGFYPGFGETAKQEAAAIVKSCFPMNGWIGEEGGCRGLEISFGNRSLEGKRGKGSRKHATPPRKMRSS